MTRASGAIGGLSRRNLGRYAVQPRPRNRSVALFGDSRTNQCSGSTGWRNNGYIHWLRFLTGQRFDVKFDTSLGVYATQPADSSGTPSPVHDNFGVSGNTTTQMLDRCDKMLAATSAGTFIVFGGVNDRLTGISYATSVTNMSTIIDKLLAAGRFVILVAEMPTGDAANTGNRLSTTALLRDHIRFHQWVLDQRNRPGVIVVDIWPAIADNSGTSTTVADVRSGTCYDGRHPQMNGAYLIARALQPAIEALFPPLPILPASPSDTYDASNNPFGCLAANPMMAGSGGSLGTNCTGTIAASWQAAGGSGTTGATATYSKQSDGFGNPVQRAVIAGTATGSASVCYFDLLRTASFHASCLPGDIIEGVAGLSVASGATGLISLGLRLEVTVDGVQTYIMDGDQRTAGQYLPGGGFSGIFRTPRFQVPAGASLTSAVAKIQAYLDPNVAAALTMDVGAVAVRRVS